MNINPKILLQEMFVKAIEAAQPKQNILNYLPSSIKGKLIVIGAGKASAEMAHVIEQHWQTPLTGIVVTRYGYASSCKHIQIIEAAHPVPDLAGLLATKKILEQVNHLTENDTVLCLISGGGSALLTYPIDGMSLQEKQSINKQLLASGASIKEMNCVRRHLSNIKGGKLAAACYPAKVITLAISDVPGDNPADVASGPTYSDSSTCAEALAIIQRYQIKCSDKVLEGLRLGKNESIKPDDYRIKNNQFYFIATPYQSLQAAAQFARQYNIPCYILGDNIEGESKEVAKVIAGITRAIVEYQHPFQSPCILLSGGETTVTIKGNGSGGRNVEFLLSLAIALQDCSHIYALAGDTDGVDGVAEIAGAIITPTSLSRAWQLNLNPQHFLDNNDGHSFFEKLNDQIITGPTLTNVNDFRAIYIM